MLGPAWNEERRKQQSKACFPLILADRSVAIIVGAGASQVGLQSRPERWCDRVFRSIDFLSAGSLFTTEIFAENGEGVYTGGSAHPAWKLLRAACDGCAVKMTV